MLRELYVPLSLGSADRELHQPNRHGPGCRAGSLRSVRCVSMGAALQVSMCVCLHAAFFQGSGSLLHKKMLHRLLG